MFCFISRIYFIRFLSTPLDTRRPLSVVYRVVMTRRGLLVAFCIPKYNFFFYLYWKKSSLIMRRGEGWGERDNIKMSKKGYNGTRILYLKIHFLKDIFLYKRKKWVETFLFIYLFSPTFSVNYFQIRLSFFFFCKLLFLLTSSTRSSVKASFFFIISKLKTLKIINNYLTTHR